MKIEERAKELLEPMARGEYSLDEAYIKGATDQKKIDIQKLKDIMNRLMLDTKDKAEIIKELEE